MLDYYIYLAISFLGIGAGWALAKIAWEEIDQYEIFLKALRYACLAGILAAIIIYTDKFLLGAAILASTALLHYRKEERWAYTILPSFIWLSHGTPALPWVVSLLLLYGFSEGSLQAHKIGKKGKKADALLTLLQDNYWYLVIGVLLGIIL